MGAGAQTIKQRDVQGVTFDVSSFMRSIINNVDRSRGDLGPLPSKIVDSIADEPADERIESRINAFYRLIGLPATRNDSIITTRQLQNQNTTDEQLSQNGTLNYISPGSISVKNPNNEGEFLPGNDAANLLVAREKNLQKPPTVQQMVNLVTQPLPLDASVKANVQRRAPLFPILVDASVPIFPLSKRTAPLFHDGDFILSGASSTRLPRPFIENVIYMRTQVFAAGGVEELKTDLAKNIRTFVLGNAQPLTTEEEDQTAQQFIDSLGLQDGGQSIQDFTLLELKMINKFVQAIRKSANNYRGVLNRAAELKKKVKFAPEAKDTPREAGGNSTEIIEGLVAGSIDKTISALEAQLSEVTSFINLMPTNEVKRADTSYRAEGDEIVKNIIPDAFISDFNNLITFDKEDIQSRLSSAKAQRKRDITEYNLIRERIQYFTGEVTGLSIFDILCTFLALFTISVESLILLLNRDARENLLNSPFYSFQNAPGNNNVLKTPIFDNNDVTSRVQAILNVSSEEGVSGALEELENKIRENFKLATAFFEDSVKSGPGSPGVVGSPVRPRM